MNGIEFFMRRFGDALANRLGLATGDDHTRADALLRRSLPLADQTTTRAKGFLLLPPGGGAAKTNVPYAFCDGQLAETVKGETWRSLLCKLAREGAGDAFMLIDFGDGKRLFSAGHLFVTYDLRRVRLCRNDGPVDIDMARLMRPGEKPVTPDEKYLAKVLSGLAASEGKLAELAHD